MQSTMDSAATRFAIASVLFAALLAGAGCQPDMPAPAATQPASAEAAVPVATETTPAQAGVQPDGAAIDTKAFAGTFTGALPCADCPGIDETLALAADGTFTLTNVYRERPDATFTERGSWSIDADAKRLRLDPGSKAGRDRLFAIDDNDTLVALGPDGERGGDALHYRLARGR